MPTTINAANSLNGCVFVVTGASSGIGLAVAKAAAREGMRVVLSARNQPALSRAAEEIRNAGGEAEAIAADVADIQQVRHLINATLERWQRIDAFFANAGFGYYHSASHETHDLHRKVFEVNYWGTIHCAREILPVMLRRQSGHFLVCSSVVARIGAPFFAAYAASKAAQDAWLKSLRVEMKDTPIEISGVYPIGTRTDWMQTASKASGFDETIETAPESMMQTPEHVARCVIKCLRRPRPEVWTSTPVRLAAAIGGLFPRLIDYGQYRNSLPLREALGSGGVSPPQKP